MIRIEDKKVLYTTLDSNLVKDLNCLLVDLKARLGREIDKKTIDKSVIVEEALYSILKDYKKNGDSSWIFKKLMKKYNI